MFSVGCVCCLKIGWSRKKIFAQILEVTAKERGIYVEKSAPARGRDQSKGTEVEMDQDVQRTERRAEWVETSEGEGDNRS